MEKGFEASLTPQEKEKIEHTKRPERSQRLLDFLERTDAFQFFQNIDKGNSEQPEVNFEQFKDFVTRINGIARDIPIKERRFDGERVQLSGGLLGEKVIMPRHEDKEELLEYAFDSAHNIKREDAAYMLPLILNAVHPFNDGNGRTARVLHLLLSEKTEEKFTQSAEKALSADGRFDSLDLTPAILNYEVMLEILGEHDWIFSPEKRSPVAHKVLRGHFGNAELSKANHESESWAFLTRFEELRQADPEYILTATVEALGEEKYVSLLIDEKILSPVLMQKNLVKEDWENIFDKYFAIKREHIKELVDVFVHPDVHYNSRDKNETLKDFFIRKVNETYQENQE